MRLFGPSKKELIEALRLLEARVETLEAAIDEQDELLAARAAEIIRLEITAELLAAKAGSILVWGTLDEEPSLL